MSFFDDIISDGIAAGESAWGTTFSLDESSRSFTGTFDRHQNSGAPEDGGYLDQITATIVCSRTQFDVLLNFATESGGEFLTESGESMLLEDEDQIFPRVGRRLTHGGKRYMITSVESDASSFTMTLRSVNR